MSIFDAYGDEVWPSDVLSGDEYVEWLVETGQIKLNPEEVCICGNCPDCVEEPLC